MFIIFSTFHKKKFLFFAFTQMRHEMVLQKEGEIEISLLTHSDNMKRVSTRTQRFVQNFVDINIYQEDISFPPYDIPQMHTTY